MAAAKSGKGKQREAERETLKKCSPRNTPFFDRIPMIPLPPLWPGPGLAASWRGHFSGLVAEARARTSCFMNATVA